MATKVFTLKEIGAMREVTEQVLIEKMSNLPYGISYTAQELSHLVEGLASAEHFSSTFSANESCDETRYLGRYDLCFKVIRKEKKRHYAELNDAGEIIRKFDKTDYINTYVRIK